MKKSLALILCGVCFSLSSLAAPAIQCDTEDWVGSHGVADGDAFHGTLTSACDITDTSGSGLTELLKYLVDQTSARFVVNAGPVAETYLDLPSRLFDVTAKDDSEELQVRSDLHIASDGKTRLEYASLSKEIQGSGNSQFLQQMDIKFTVTPGSNNNSYRFVLSTTLAVKRPWYAPVGVFESQAEKVAHEKYLQNRSATAPDIAAHL